MSSPIRIGLVTISDRASSGVYEDKGGPVMVACLTEILSCEWEAVPRLIPDDQPTIKQTLIERHAQSEAEGREVEDMARPVP